MTASQLTASPWEKTRARPSSSTLTLLTVAHKPKSENDAAIRPISLDPLLLVSCAPRLLERKAHSQDRCRECDLLFAPSPISSPASRLQRRCRPLHPDLPCHLHHSPSHPIPLRLNSSRPLSTKPTNPLPPPSTKPNKPTAPTHTSVPRNLANNRKPIRPRIAVLRVHGQVPARTPLDNVSE